MIFVISYNFQSKNTLRQNKLLSCFVGSVHRKTSPWKIWDKNVALSRAVYSCMYVWVNKMLFLSIFYVRSLVIKAHRIHKHVIQSDTNTIITTLFLKYTTNDTVLRLTLLQKEDHCNEPYLEYLLWNIAWLLHSAVLYNVNICALFWNHDKALW